MEERNEVRLCLSHYEASGWRQRISHCILVSNLGLVSVAYLADEIAKQWPCVPYCTQYRVKADGTSDETWPAALAKRTLAEPGRFQLCMKEKASVGE